MFDKSKKVISITREKILVTEVLDAAAKKFGRSYEFGWEMATLDLVFTEIIRKFSTRNFRILVGDDLSYVLRVSVPAEIKKESERAFVLDKIQDKIPETVSNGEWDYREISDKNETGGHDVIAFALVKSFAKSLTIALDKTGLHPEAIEPESIAKTRNVNAIIGISLKSDLAGLDENVLNLTLDDLHNDHKDYAPKRSQGFRIRFKFVLIFVLIVLTGLLVGGFFYAMNNLREDGALINPLIDTPTPAATAEASPSPTPADLSAVKVQVQNGSGVSGIADSVSQTLELEGLTNITAGNADNFNHTDTSVSYKPDYENLYAVVERSLGDLYTVVRGEKLPPEADFDIVIVVGRAK